MVWSYFDGIEHSFAVICFISLRERVDFVGVNKDNIVKLRDSYPFKCCNCGWEGILVPNIAMQCGINSGVTTCKKCDEMLDVRVDGSNNHAECRHIDQHKEPWGDDDDFDMFGVGMD